MSETEKPWHNRSNEQLRQLFQMEPAAQVDYPDRSDIFVGTTVLPELWERHYSSEAVYSSDFSKCGESFCYLKIDGIDGLEGSVFVDKSQIEDTLDEALRHLGVGCVIGSSTGLRYSYVDFAVTDVVTAINVVRKVLRAGNIPKRSWIIFFDTDKSNLTTGVWDDSPLPP